MKTALTIAGTDSSGGAGVQADIKTLTCHGVFAMCAMTALTAQNTTGVSDVLDVGPDFLREQIKMCAIDIFPDAVKTGMISSPEQARVIAECVREYSLKNIVVDPVMVATSGARLVSEETICEVQKSLFPLALIVTPNIPEAEVIAGLTITSKDDMEKAASIIYREYGCAVLVKGGHSSDRADDFLFGKNGGIWLEEARIENPNAHGTGCTLSSAICAGLALDMSLEDSVREAKKYISDCLRQMLNLGKGRGPLHHIIKKW
ncbi:MAG: bifunctional hydroxymethylpyrimidine kinase/phosphomethylpyrimidine kinase [Treponema sp.]|nr:bifunctional hydroxymethylpyrimidine kinase/phosphomethylpyrimidine kinase [Treponema sp.]MBD5443009.1 bifunctional hydroxymethylpyrimidine kinase/phosphomethylpyrimidine kinase [Treponema sp.]